MFRLVPPAGTPTTVSDLSRMLFRRTFTRQGERSFEKKIKEMLGTRNCLFFGSGRAALASLLIRLAARAQTGRDEVIVPAYTCFTVPASAVRAGLKVRLVDIRPDTLDYDYDQLSRIDRSKVVAVISCNLLGIVSDMHRLAEVIGRDPIFLIDDACQTFGVVDGNVPCGCRGIAGIVSLGRGKHMSTYAGGLLVTNDDTLAAEIRKSSENLPGPGLISEGVLATEIVLSSLMLRPSLYWMPDRLPFLGLGKTEWEPDFHLGRLSPLQCELGNILIDRLESMNSRRAQISGRIASAATATSDFEIPGYRDVSTPAYLRLPLLARDRHHRDACIEALQASGIKASMMYPSTIRHIEGIAAHMRADSLTFPGADQVVERLLTIPVHGFVNEADVERIIACLVGYKQGMPADV